MPGNQPFVGDIGFSRPLAVPLQGILQPRLEVISHHPEPDSSGLLNILGALAFEYVGVVHHKRLLCDETGLQNQGFSFAGFEHVQVDAHMRGKKVFLVKGGFARCGDSNE